MQNHLPITLDGICPPYRPKVAQRQNRLIYVHDQYQRVSCGQEQLQQQKSYRNKSRYRHKASDLCLSDELPRTSQVQPQCKTALYPQHAGGAMLSQPLKLEYWRQTGIAPRDHLQRLNQYLLATSSNRGTFVPLLTPTSDLFAKKWTPKIFGGQPIGVVTQAPCHVNERAEEKYNVVNTLAQHQKCEEQEYGEKVRLRIFGATYACNSVRHSENTTWAPPSMTKWRDAIMRHPVCACPLYDCHCLTSLEHTCEAFPRAIAGMRPKYSSAQSMTQKVNQSESNEESKCLPALPTSINMATPDKSNEEQPAVNPEVAGLPAMASSGRRKRKQHRGKRKGFKRRGSQGSQTADEGLSLNELASIGRGKERRHRKRKGTAECSSTQASKPRVQPSVYGFILMFTFLGAWMLGMTLFGIAFGVAHQYNHYLSMICFFLAYYIFRRFRPAKVWPRMRTMFAEGWTNHPYFRTQHTIMEEVIEPKSKTLIAAHPHGILCCGMITTLVCAPELAKSDVRFLVSDMLFKFPFVADLLRWAKCGPADKETMIGAMRQGDNLSLLPGGYQEATLYRRNEHRVYIKNRKGFIKYALMHGYKVHPSYIFGEEKTYLAASWLQEKLLFLNKWKLPAVVFIGKWFMFMPEDQLDMVTVVGRSLQLPLIAKPSQEDIDHWHSRYMEELQSVFDRNKGKYAAESNQAKLVML